MIELESTLRNCIVCEDKLIPFGFIETEEGYFYAQQIMNGLFEIRLLVEETGRLKGDVYDLSIDKTYPLLRVMNVQEPFVTQVRAAYKEVLQKVIDSCFSPCVLSLRQGQFLFQWIKKHYDDEPDFPFRQYPQFAVFRYPSNHKWYGLFMNLPRQKVDNSFPYRTDRKVDVLNLRVKKHEIEQKLTVEGVYPAYHMNKKSWVSLTLDDSISDDLICQWVEESRLLAIQAK